MGGFSPGRTLGPVVNGPVRVGLEGLLGAVVVRPTDEGVGVGLGSAPPPVQAASNPAISPIARKRKRTHKSWQAGSRSTSERPAAVDDRRQVTAVGTSASRRPSP